MNQKLIKNIKKWVKDYEKSQPKNVMIEDDSFEGSAYFLFQNILAQKQNPCSEEVDVCGTSLQGYMPDDTTYADLVKVFGEPGEGDGEKVDAEWQGQIDGEVFTIYNYKTGVNYNGKDGIATCFLRGADWHIGGRSLSVVEKVINYFNKEKNK